MNYERMLTPTVKKHIAQSILAAKWEGNDCVEIEYDRIVSIFSSNLTNQEYQCFDWDKATDFLIDYADDQFEKSFEKYAI